MICFNDINIENYRHDDMLIILINYATSQTVRHMNNMSDLSDILTFLRENWTLLPLTWHGIKRDARLLTQLMEMQHIYTKHIHIYCKVHTRQLINSHIHGIISVKFDGARTHESFDIFFVDKSNYKPKYLIEMITSQLRSDKVWDQFVSFIYNVTTNWPLWIIRIYEEPCNYRLLEEESDWAIIYKVRHRSHKYYPNFFDKCSHFT